MTRDVRVPKWGLTIELITVDRWLVAVGDRVTAGQPLCEVLTDKATSEVEAPASGTVLELCVAPGTDCAVGDLLARLDVG